MSPNEANFNPVNSAPGKKRVTVRFGASLSPLPSVFAPLLFAGKLTEGLELLPVAGFSAAEISLRRVNDIDVQWLENRTRELGLVVSALATGRICLEDSLCLCDTNSIARKQLLERLTDLIQLAARFKASVIIGGVRGKLSGDEEHKREQYQAAVETLHECAVTAGDYGVNLLLEPINRYETNFINTCIEGVKLIEEVGHPCVKLLLDTFHMNIEEKDPCSSIRDCSKHIGYIHFADSNRQAPGQGHINFATIMDALADIQYKGFITVEILPIPDDSQAMFRAGQYLKTLMLER